MSEKNHDAITPESKVISSLMKFASENSDVAECVAQLVLYLQSDTYKKMHDAFDLLIDDNGGIITQAQSARPSIRIKKKIGNIIASKRTQLGLSQKELSDKTGIPQPRISRMEVGTAKLKPGHWEKLKEALQMDEQDIPS